MVQLYAQEHNRVALGPELHLLDANFRKSVRGTKQGLYPYGPLGRVSIVQNHQRCRKQVVCGGHGRVVLVPDADAGLLQIEFCPVRDLGGINVDVDLPWRVTVGHVLIDREGNIARQAGFDDLAAILTGKTGNKLRFTGADPDNQCLVRQLLDKIFLGLNHRGFISVTGQLSLSMLTKQGGENHR